MPVINLHTLQNKAIPNYDRIQSDTCNRLRTFDPVSTEAEIERRLQEVAAHVLDYEQAVGSRPGADRLVEAA